VTSIGATYRLAIDSNTVTLAASNFRCRRGARRAGMRMSIAENGLGRLRSAGSLRRAARSPPPLIRQRIAERPQAGGKLLLETAGYRYQALWTNLPTSLSPLMVRRRYNGRADIENRIKELGEQFGIKRLAVKNFGAPKPCITWPLPPTTSASCCNASWASWTSAN
jgi:hypothetical protein